MSHNSNYRTVSPSKVKHHMPKITIPSSEKSRSSRSKSRESDEDGSSGRGSIGKRIGAQFFVENTASMHNRPSIKGFEGFEHLILSSGEEEDEASKAPFLGDSTYISCSSLKTGIILEDNDIRTSRTNSGSGPDFTLIRDQDSIPKGINVFEDVKEQTRENQHRFQSRVKKSTILNETPVSSASASVEEDLTYVTEQLQIIQQTQDSILNSLRTDIEVVQAENTLLSQKNQQLQSQVSHLNQLVADLSMDLRHMRDVVRSKQALGVSLSLLHRKDPNYFTEEESNSMIIDYTSKRSTGNQATPSVILSHVQTQMNHPSHNHKRQRSQEQKNGPHRKDRSATRPGTATSKQIPLDSKATNYTIKAEKNSKNVKEKKSTSSKKTVGTLNGNDPTSGSAYVESSTSKQIKSPGCFSRIFGGKKNRRKED